MSRGYDRRELYGREDRLVATIVEVAALAGVSISTVSHVLNDTRRVEPATRRRVLDAIEKTSYRQDALARALRRSRTDSIGLVIPDAGEPAFAEMVHGVEHTAAALGLTLLLANSAENLEREQKSVQVLLERRVDGLILARAGGSSDELIEMLSRESTPVVLLDRLQVSGPFDQIGAENREPMRELVAHLTSAGHRRFVVVAGDTRVSTLAERTSGFTIAAHDAGLDLGAQHIISGPERGEEFRALIAKSLETPRLPTAYIACSSVLAVDTLSTFRSLGLRTPRDVAFATFDGFSHSDLFEPTITTVRPPAFEVGAAAVGLLNDRLKGSTSQPRTVYLQQSIDFRDSTELYAFKD